jgi:hypothetical protein
MSKNLLKDDYVIYIFRIYYIIRCQSHFFFFFCNSIAILKLGTKVPETRRSKKLREVDLFHYKMGEEGEGRK